MRIVFRAAVIIGAAASICPAGGSAATFGPKQIPSPRIASVSPAFVLAGSSSHAVTTNGTGFLPTSSASLRDVAPVFAFANSQMPTCGFDQNDSSSEETPAEAVTKPLANEARSPKGENRASGAFLRVIVTGLPEGVIGNVDVQEPDGKEITLGSNQQDINGIPGSYVVSTTMVQASSCRFFTSPKTREVKLGTGEAETVKVDYYTVIPDTTIVDQADTARIIVLSKTRIKLPKDNGVAKSLQAGDVLASERTKAHEGFLVRIVKTVIDGPFMYATVEPATLEDAIFRANVSFEWRPPSSKERDVRLIDRPVLKTVAARAVDHVVMSSQAASSPVTDPCSGKQSTLSHSLKYPNGTKADAGGQGGFSTSGTIDICPDVLFKVDINFYKVKSVMAVATFSEYANLELKTELHETYDKTFHLGAPVHFGFFVIVIGDVPVTVEPTIQFYVKVLGDGKGHVTARVEESADAKAGVSYVKGRTPSTQPIRELKQHARFFPPTADATLRAKGYAGAEIAFLLDRTLAPKFDLAPYVQFDSNTTADPWWTLIWGIEGHVGVSVQFLGKHLNDIDGGEVFNFSSELAQAKGPFLSSGAPPGP